MISKNLLIVGVSGGIGSQLIEALSKKFERVYAVDIFDLEEKHLLIENLSFEKADARDGFSLKTLDFIQAHASSGICFLNLLGNINSKSFVSLMACPASHHKNFASHSDSLRKDFELNFCIPISLSIEFANLVLSERGFGNVINFSSISSTGNTGQLGYSSMKSAIETATVVMGQEYGLFNIRFNCIAPGFMDTISMEKSVSKSRKTQILARTPLRKFGAINSLIPVIESLVQSNFINGQTIRVDGGLRL